MFIKLFFFFQAEDGIRDGHVTGVQTCALPILILRALKPYRAWVALVILFQIAGVLAALYLPTINADIIDDGGAQADIQGIRDVGMLVLLRRLGDSIAPVVARRYSPRPATRSGGDL